MELKPLFANITLSAILLVVAVILVSEWYAFWHDRSLWGNVLVTAATMFIIGWLIQGIVGAW